jgi:CrcB protein
VQRDGRPGPVGETAAVNADHDLPIDPDVDVREPVAGWDVLAVTAAGGALGSLARWGLGDAIGHAPADFPWATVAVNVSGSLALGVLMVLVAEVWSRSRYLRAFLGVGLLGGWTTFSTYALDARTLIAHDRMLTALLYVGSSLLLGLPAVLVGLRVTRRVVA